MSSPLRDEECDDDEDECLNESVLGDSKHMFYEMAQPRHENTVFSIPINNTDGTGPMTIMFMAKTARCYGITDNRIDMSDVDFATEVAVKYGNGSKRFMNDISTAVVSCYNDFVVEHNSTMKSKMPTDTIVVDRDTATRRIVPR